MFNAKIEEIWYKSKILTKAFLEYQFCIEGVYLKANSILKSPANTPEEFKVSFDKIPEDFFSLRRNIFSTLFQSMYKLLNIKEERRLLYGRLNHLFRIWVTSADNLLDGEDKIVVPIKIAGNSRIMRQVISIMVADRIMRQILQEATSREVITLSESNILSDRSLQVLLPSAAQEASEEGGIIYRPEPEYVLYTIHRLKTGILFHIPFLGPEIIEKNVNLDMLTKCKDGLAKFGLGCQLLDDIRDMARDYLEKRHNYVLSKIYWENRSSEIGFLKKIEDNMNSSTKIFSQFPEIVFPTAELAKNLLEEGLFLLVEAGLGVSRNVAIEMAASMFKILDVSEVKDACLCR